MNLLDQKQQQRIQLKQFGVKGAEMSGWKKRAKKKYLNKKQNNLCGGCRNKTTGCENINHDVWDLTNDEEVAFRQGQRVMHFCEAKSKECEVVIWHVKE